MKHSFDDKIMASPPGVLIEAGFARHMAYMLEFAAVKMKDAEAVRDALKQWSIEMERRSFESQLLAEHRDNWMTAAYAGASVKFAHVKASAAQPER